MWLHNKFENIRDSYYNGAISQAKDGLKSLSRKDRYDFLIDCRQEMQDESLFEDAMKWCVTGDFSHR